jgi:hypothetical protein
MKRVVTPELLDTDSGTAADIARSLADLRRINRWFGGVATTELMVTQVARERGTTSISLLEVAAGSGYVPHTVRRRLEHHGLNVEVTLLDRAQSHLNGAPRAVVGDALELPFPDSSFDLVSCNLFAHHLSPEAVVRLAGEGLRVCRVALLINDLIRHPLHLALVYAGFPLYRGRLTRNDAPASVRAAYTVEELRMLVGQSPASRIDTYVHYLFRMGMVAWKG